MDEEISHLLNKIRSKTWNGEYFGENGVLSLTQKVQMLWRHSTQKDYRVVSALSSIYYSAAGHLHSQARISKIPNVLYLAIAWWYLRIAEKFSNQFEKKILAVNMTSDELDVRSSILIKRHHIKKACNLIEFAIHKCSEEHATKPLTATLTTMALLHCKLGICYRKQGNERAVGNTYFKLRTYIPRIDQKQAIRVLRCLAEYNFEKENFHQANNDIEAALELAQKPELGAQDQLIKLQPLLKKIKRKLRN